MSSDPILQDLFEKHRLFLPGQPCSKDEVLRHFEKAILVDGLNREEARLVLSTLPSRADRIYLAPLDKGLSGSKVFSAKFDTGGERISKVFVFKIGAKGKIFLEYEALETLVVPYLNGVSRPVYRVGEASALIVVEFAGLGGKTALESLKTHIRDAREPEKVIGRLLEERLSGWYRAGSRRPPPVAYRLETLFEWYLAKIAGQIYPADWAALQEWVESSTDCPWRDASVLLSKLKRSTIESCTTTVHGDLHSQNVLIDERGECWPIDFAWCRENTSPLLDFTMLECSLKFLAVPHRSDLRSLIGIEFALASAPFPEIELDLVPYRQQISNVMRAVIAVRRFAIERMGLRFEDYRRALCLMTYVHSTHPKLNLPYVLASLQILGAKCYV